MADFELQYLKHGKALCGKVFGTFVETFNRLIDFHANLKGDGDVSDDGLVTVDRADPAHPVIRIDRSRLTTSGGGGSGGGDEDESPAVVTSVNGADGDVRVIGGENIEVTTDGNTIKVSYREGKDPDEPPGADPCAHDGVGGAGGGVSALADGATGGDWGPGGVPAGGDSHPGDDGCNCD